MSASTGMIQGSAQGSIFRPLLPAVAAVVAALAIAAGALGLASTKPTVAPTALREVGQTELSSSQRAKFPGEAVGTNAGSQPVVNIHRGPRAQ